MEVLVAALVLAFGLLGVAMMQYTAITGNAFGKEMQTATMLCQEVLEIVRATPVKKTDGTKVDAILKAGNNHPVAGVDDVAPLYSTLANPVHGAATFQTQTGGVSFTRVWWVVDDCRGLAINDPPNVTPICNPQPAAACAINSDNMKAIAVRTCWTDRNGGNHAVTLLGEKWDSSLNW